MKKCSLYFKLAFQNIKNSRKFYIPYLLAGTFTSMMCYILFYLLRDDKLNSSYGGSTLLVLREFMSIGVVICTIFSVIIVFYTNSFLMKRRKKEIGLYNILGMEKRHLAGVQLVETLSIAIASVISGIACGVIFSKLVLLLLCRITHLTAPFGFHIDIAAAGITAIIFAGIYFLALIYNIVQVGKAKPVDLLKSENVGQKPPKAKWVLTIVGILTLGAGYAMALLNNSVFTAIMLFLVAVLLVIIGTYCLFTSGSITILKAMQKNKKYYYKSSHFTGVSGMIYRMKANAVGLANICILSTMVLVTVSTTVALNIGAEDMIASRYPHDMAMYIGKIEDTKAPSMLDDMNKIIYEKAKAKGVAVTNTNIYRKIDFTAGITDSGYSTKNIESVSADDVTMVGLMSINDYNKLNNVNISLSDTQVLAYSRDNDIKNKFTLFGKQYEVTGSAEKHVLIAESQVYVTKVHLFVVTDSEYDRITSEQIKAYGKYASYGGYMLDVDLDADDNVKSEISEQTKDIFYKKIDDGKFSSVNYNFSGKIAGREEVFGMYGGFLFLGIFFGLLFLMATVLIIYYKQLSEGYEDKERFNIMQKVGMSEHEVKKTIRSQVLTVFFLPICVAVIHLAAAFKMISMLLKALGLMNVGLYIICMICTIIAFALIYALVYAITSRAYYKIVSRK